MAGRLVLASLLTVFLLLSVVGLLLAAVMYFFGGVSLPLVIAFTVFFNVVAFFLSPWVQDALMVWLYGARIYTVDEFRRIAPEISDMIEKVSREYGFQPPKIMYIPDRNPTAFTYGSTRSMARIAISEGILEYLEPDERKAVVAHELGHIVHYDFAVMAVATTLLMILYEIYVWGRRTLESSEEGRKEGRAIILAAIAFLSYIFYIIGRYIVLYLSRVREYYADEFSARKTSPKSLASALIKIAYGIITVPDDHRSRRLLRSTEALGIMGEKAAREGALIADYLKNHPERLGRVLAWDVYSPWAFLSELSSTHPLTGKRVLRLLKMAGEQIHVPKPDMGRTYAGFVADLIVYTSPITFPVLLGGLAYVLTVSWVHALLGMLVGFGTSFLLRGVYSYPGGEAEERTLIDLLEDPYASPVRGKKVRFRGRIIGRGTPGYVFGEDLAATDGTGIVFVNYESWLPGLGNLLFAIGRVRSLIGKDVYVEGWYFRSVSPWLDLSRITNGEEIKSYPHLRYWLWAALVLAPIVTIL